jgi:hypothetical protein
MLLTMRGQRWATLGILALLALDLVLIVAAMWPSAAPALPSAMPSTAVSTAMSASPSSAAPSPTPTLSASAPPVEAAPLARLVSSVGRDIAWVVDTGSCSTAGTSFRTKDAGSSWTSHPAPGYVTRVRPSSADTAFVVGGGRDCAFSLWSTDDGGASWAGPQSARAAWGRSPKNAATVERPGGAPVTPCAKDAVVVDLTGIDRSTAAVLCSDGAVRETSNGGSSWTTAVDQKRALALSWDAAGTGVLAETADGCDGVAVVAVRGGAAAKPVCIDGLTPVTGKVAISSAGGAVWVVAGDRAAVAKSAQGPWTLVKGRVA